MTTKRMLAKYHGRDAHTGAQINPGDEIIFDTATRQAWHTNEDFHHATPPAREYRSDLIFIGGREYYRNKAGRCEDAPCCGCCTI